MAAQSAPANMAQHFQSFPAPEADTNLPGPAAATDQAAQGALNNHPLLPSKRFKNAHVELADNGKAGPAPQSGEVPMYKDMVIEGKDGKIYYYVIKVESTISTPDGNVEESYHAVTDKDSKKFTESFKTLLEEAFERDPDLAGKPLTFTRESAKIPNSRLQKHTVTIANSDDPTKNVSLNSNSVSTNPKKRPRLGEHVHKFVETFNEVTSYGRKYDNGLSTRKILKPADSDATGAPKKPAKRAGASVNAHPKAKKAADASTTPLIEALKEDGKALTSQEVAKALEMGQENNLRVVTGRDDDGNPRPLNYAELAEHPINDQKKPELILVQGEKEDLMSFVYVNGTNTSVLSSKDQVLGLSHTSDGHKKANWWVPGWRSDVEKLFKEKGPNGGLDAAIANFCLKNKQTSIDVGQFPIKAEEINDAGLALHERLRGNPKAVFQLPDLSDAREAREALAARLERKEAAPKPASQLTDEQLKAELKKGQKLQQIAKEHDVKDDKFVALFKQIRNIAERSFTHNGHTNPDNAQKLALLRKMSTELDAKGFEGHNLKSVQKAACKALHLKKNAIEAKDLGLLVKEILDNSVLAAAL